MLYSMNCWIFTSSYSESAAKALHSSRRNVPTSTRICSNPSTSPDRFVRSDTRFPSHSEPLSSCSWGSTGRCPCADEGTGSLRPAHSAYFRLSAPSPQPRPDAHAMWVEDRRSWFPWGARPRERASSTLLGTVADSQR